MGLKEDLLRGIYAYGFEKPSAIQQRAILPIINGRDVIAQAQSGTGEATEEKNNAFLWSFSFFCDFPCRLFQSSLSMYVHWIIISVREAYTQTHYTGLQSSKNTSLSRIPPPKFSSLPSLFLSPLAQASPP